MKSVYPPCELCLVIALYLKMLIKQKIKVKIIVCRLWNMNRSDEKTLPIYDKITYSIL